MSDRDRREADRDRRELARDMRKSAKAACERYPKFSGQPSENFQLWWQGFKGLLLALELPEYERSRLCRVDLTGAPLNHATTKVWSQANAIWETFEDYMLNNSPWGRTKSHKDTAVELARIRQGTTESFLDYLHRLEALHPFLHFASDAELESAKRTALMAGLRPDLEEKLFMFNSNEIPYNTLVKGLSKVSTSAAAPSNPPREDSRKRS